MSFLLKIVQGPNAGAEIALAEGTTVSFGRGDSCDIILTDAALEEKAFELEVTGERVMLYLPDGSQMRLEPFHVRTVGTTALVTGPAEGVWKALVWEEMHPEKAAAKESSGSAAEEAPATVAAETPEKKRGRRRFFRIFLFLLFLLFVLLGVWYFFPAGMSKITGGRSERFAEKFRPPLQKSRCIAAAWFKSEETKKAEAVARIPKETLSEIAEAYGLQTESTPSGMVRVKGDFATRVDRLQATARIYRVQPGVELDFADGESLRVAVENVLSLVTEGRVKLASVAGRTAHLTGAAASVQDLRRTLEALSRDVPKLERADCSAVTVGGALSAGEKEETGETGAIPENVVLTQAKAAADAEKQPSLPVVGILATPYPCLVLSNGSRVMEGARFGAWTITAITPDSVELSGASGKFTWRP